VTTVIGTGRLGPLLRQVMDAVVEVARSDPRITGVLVNGSVATGSADEFSDADLVIVCRDTDQPELLREAKTFAEGLGPLLVSFTGEHVGEPRLLIALYGPPPVHVDLKFVRDRDLDDRVEDGAVLWQRDGSVTAALGRAEAHWPGPDPQWIEDRIWVWVHYAAAKIGRGELFEVLDMLASLRGMVFGPLIAQSRGQRPTGVRRIEQYAADLVPALERTLGAHDPHSCVRAVEASVELYRQLRDSGPGVQRRTAAETASLDYLAAVAARLTA
jgi:predicted nucleotidyltransferase